jgi:hypothetical protein
MVGGFKLLAKCWRGWGDWFATFLPYGFKIQDWCAYSPVRIRVPPPFSLLISISFIYNPRQNIRQFSTFIFQPPCLSANREAVSKTPIYSASSSHIAAHM